jgi:hypothetical protein
MTPDDIAALLRIKQAREQRAEHALRQGQAAQLRAVRARARADLAAAEFAVERRGQEEAVYRMLYAGPIPGQRLRQAAAQLSGIAAYGDMLGQRVTQAARHETACVETSSATRRTYASASREALGVASLHQRLTAATRTATEQSHDMEVEESAALREPAMPGQRRP